MIGKRRLDILGFVGINYQFLAGASGITTPAIKGYIAKEFAGNGF